jgi:hypothetical protein
MRPGHPRTLAVRQGWPGWRLRVPGARWYRGCRHARLPQSAGYRTGQTKGARSLVNLNEPQDDTPDDAGSDAEPAYILTEGIAYVRGWAHAARATTALERELRACGLSDALPYMRAEVNVFGVGIIELGHITPETAHALAGLLARARAIPTTANPTTAKEDTQHGSAA